MIDDYRKWLHARQYSEKTIKSYTDKVGQFLLNYPNPFPITIDDIETYFSTLRTSGISISYFELHFYAIRSFFNYLVSLGKSNLKINPSLISNLKPLHRQRRTPKILSDDELFALLGAPDLKTVRGCRDYAIMLVLLHGLRAQEICDLNIDNIFMDGWSFSRKMIIDVMGKGRKRRRVVAENSGDTKWAWDRYLKMRNEYHTNIAFPALLGKGKNGTKQRCGLKRPLPSGQFVSTLPVNRAVSKSTTSASVKPNRAK